MSHHASATGGCGGTEGGRNGTILGKVRIRRVTLGERMPRKISDRNDEGFVKTDPMIRETSIPGIYAAGDLATRGQAAINAELTADLVTSGMLP